MNQIGQKETIIIKPQEGPQEQFLTTSADVAIYGGAAGGGKTYALLLEPTRHINNPMFGAVIFRREYTQVTSEGGLWDTSSLVYRNIGGEDVKSPKLHWKFKSGAKVNFAHLGRDKDCESWQGSQIVLIGFDELTHFTKHQFFYMLSRNRSASGIRPYVRATCNPDADSWVAEFISWWIDQETGYPILERSGTIRYMVRIDDVITWGNTKEELIEKGDIKEGDIKSVTFIASTLEDNKILMQNDPGYLANLKALPEVERERLWKGNWKIKASAGLFFKRVQVGAFLTAVPDDIILLCRAWDLAATDEDEGGNPAYTAGVLMGRRASGRFVIIDVINLRLKAGDVMKLIKNTAVIDNAKYSHVKVRLPQDPAQAGKAQAQNYIQFLAGFDVCTISESGDKLTRATPLAAQWQNGFVDIVIGEWNEGYLNQMESFPASTFKDMVDASSSAFSELTTGNTFTLNGLV